MRFATITDQRGLCPPCIVGAVELAELAVEAVEEAEVAGEVAEEAAVAEREADAAKRAGELARDVARELSKPSPTSNSKPCDTRAASRSDALQNAQSASGVEPGTQPDSVEPNVKNGKLMRNSENLHFMDDNSNITTIRHDYAPEPRLDQDPHFNDADGGHHFYDPPGQPFDPNLPGVTTRAVRNCTTDTNKIGTAYFWFLVLRTAFPTCWIAKMDGQF